MTQWEHLTGIARQMVREPREATRALLAVQLPAGVLAPAFVVVMILSVLVTEPLLTIAATVLPGDPMAPLPRALGSIAGGLAVVWVITKLGTTFGGDGRFDQALLVFIFLELIFSVGVIALLVLTALLPYLAGLAAIAFGVYWLWMFAVALDEVFGLASPWKAFGLVIVSWVIVNYASLLILNLMAGIFGGPSNV